MKARIYNRIYKIYHYSSSHEFFIDCKIKPSKAKIKRYLADKAIQNLCEYSNDHYEISEIEIESI